MVGVAEVWLSVLVVVISIELFCGMACPDDMFHLAPHPRTHRRSEDKPPGFQARSSTLR